MQTHAHKALELESKIQAAFKDLLNPYRGNFTHTAFDKALAAAGGWAGISSQTRWPLKRFSQNDVQSLASDFRKMLPFLFKNSPKAK
jgi:hypothetical protein